MKLEDWHISVRGYVSEILDWFDLDKYKYCSEKWDAEQWRQAVAIRQGIFFEMIETSTLNHFIFEPAFLRELFLLLPCDPDEIINKTKRMFEHAKITEKDEKTLAVIEYFISFVKSAVLYANYPAFPLVSNITLESAEKLFMSGPFRGVDLNLLAINTKAPDEDILTSFAAWLSAYRKKQPEPRLKPRTEKTKTLKPSDYQRFVDWRLLPAIDFDFWLMFRGLDAPPEDMLKEILFPAFTGSKSPNFYNFKQLRQWLLSPSGYSYLCTHALKLPRNHPATKNPSANLGLPVREAPRKNL